MVPHFVGEELETAVSLKIICGIAVARIHEFRKEPQRSRLTHNPADRCVYFDPTEGVNCSVVRKQEAKRAFVTYVLTPKWKQISQQNAMQNGNCVPKVFDVTLGECCRREATMFPSPHCSRSF